MNLPESCPLCTGGHTRTTWFYGRLFYIHKCNEVGGRELAWRNGERYINFGDFWMWVEEGE